MKAAFAASDNLVTKVTESVASSSKLYQLPPNRVFSLTWLASMQIYWNKRKRLHKKRVQFQEDWFGTPKWPPWRHVKTLYKEKTVTSVIQDCH